MFSCPRISSRVIVIIQARSGFCSEDKKGCVALCAVSCVILSSKPAVGGFIAGQRCFSSGAVFPLQPSIIGSGQPEESKSPRAVTRSMLTTPRGARLQPFKKFPPTHHRFLLTLSTSNITTLSKTKSPVYDGLQGEKKELTTDTVKF